jgi:Lanthionine synthetase C-like protein
MLYSPEVHEPLVEAEWNEDRVRGAIQEIVSEAATAVGPEGDWPAHPLDVDPDWEREPPALYIGAAGMLLALGSLAASAVAEVPLDLGPAIDGALDRYRREPAFAEHAASLWMGETGVALVAHGLTGDPAHAERLLELIRENTAANPRQNDLMWGVPGTTLAACVMFDRTGDERFADARNEGIELLRAGRDEDGFWRQQLSGNVAKVIGPAHGMAGNARVLARDVADEETRAYVATALEATVVREDGLANWPPEAGGTLIHPRFGSIRTQWCHGAPGIVASLWDVAPEELMIAGGELTWRAGPLVKGPGFCHGTAGNGYAFLKLLALTGNELWLDRARAFGLHAIAQVEQAREQYGRGRFTLFTGDVGVALYLRSCLDGSAEVPTIEDWGPSAIAG